MPLSSLQKRYKSELESIYEEPEIDSIFMHVAGSLLNYSKIDIHRNLNEIIDPPLEKKILDILTRLKKSEPLQYILGKTEFYNQTIYVDTRVLIPRPETEFLVDIIVKKNWQDKAPLKIMDLCTGSGCIAIALKNSLENSVVSALEISNDALDLAKSNAFKNNASIDFFQDNLLSFSRRYDSYNMIISNPPYVRNTEKHQMRLNVLNYEPHMALFVPDSNPLQFYRSIAEFGSYYLSPKGSIYVEINEAFGKDVAGIFSDYGFIDIQIIKDLNNKDRYVNAGK